MYFNRRCLVKVWVRDSKASPRAAICQARGIVVVVAATSGSHPVVTDVGVPWIGNIPRALPFLRR